MTKTIYKTNDSVNLEKKSIEDLHFEKKFNFNKKIVFKAFTQAKHFQKWWGPLNSEITSCEIDLRIGGKISLYMNTENGLRRFSGEFYEILDDEKLIFSLNVFEKDHPFFETLNTIILSEPQPDQTILTLRIEVVKADSEKAPFALKGSRQGWLEGLEKLESFLSKNYLNV